MVLSHAGMAAAGVGLLMSAAMASESTTARAQGDAAPAETFLVIPGPDGAPVNLRSGPALDQPVVTALVAYQVVTALGPSQQVGVTRWRPVKTVANQIGWVEEPYLAAISGASPVVASASPEPTVAEAPPPPPAFEPPLLPVAAASPAPMEAVAATPVPSLAASAGRAPQASASTSTTTTTVASAPQAMGRPLDIEAKLKYPEAKGRHQEITIWVTRDGLPMPGVEVTLYTEHDEDEPMRVLEPTNLDGRTRRGFSIGKEKGEIELIVSAVAPDGGTGRTTATYFRR